MSIISDPTFLDNVERSLAIAHLSDLPLPFLVIGNKLYHNASREQIYGIMHSDGTPLSPEDNNYYNKRFRNLPAASIVEYYRKIERLNSNIKQLVLTKVGASPPLTNNYNAQQYQSLHDSLFGPGGVFLAPNSTLTAANNTILSDLFKELLNKSKGVML